MSIHASRVIVFRPIGIVTALVLSVLFTGCYTRQIEGIQQDLDLMDRKLHKAKISEPKKSSAVSPQEIQKLKLELESVQSQQMGLTNDLENLKSGVETTQFDASSLASEPYPMPIDAPNPQEMDMLRKQITDNQKQISRFDREMKDLQSTFDEVKTSMLEVIQLIQEEYVEDGPASSPVSAPSSSASDASVSMGGGPAYPSSSGGGTMYEVKAGDSLNLIASRHGVSVADLKEINQITNPDRLIMGQKIHIP